MKVGLVGCGQWGRHVLRDLLSLGCQCVVADPSAPARARALQAGATGVVTDAQALPADLAGYVVVTPASTHHGTVSALLNRGKPIYVEKPLTDQSATALELARRAEGRLFVMEKWRYHGGIQRMAELRRSGELGTPLSLHCRRVQWGQSQDDVNPVWTLLPHDLSIIDHVLGELPTPLTARAERCRHTGRPLSLYAHLMTRDVAVFVNVSSLAPIKERTVTLNFDQGTLIMANPLADHLLWKPVGGPADAPALTIPVSIRMPLLAELQAFVAHLAGGPAPMASCNEAARSVVLIDALLALADAQA